MAARVEVRSPGANAMLPLISSRVPEFVESAELALLGEEERKLSGVVVAAFGDFIARQHSLASDGGTIAELEDLLDRCYRVVEEIAASPDPHVRNRVVVDLLEPLTSDATLRALIVRRLLPHTRTLYDIWIEGRGH